MSAPYLRPSRPSDEDALKRIWKLSFSDEDSFINMFFQDFYAPGMATLMECDSQPVSCIFTFKGARVSFPGEPEMNCAYVYSLGTLPEYRGRGFGAMVIQESARRAFSEGSDAACFLPASIGLYRWYEKILGTRTRFWIRERRISRRELPEAPPPVHVEAVGASEYGALREKLLSGRPHARFDDKLLRFQEAICNYYGGGLYRLKYGGFEGCAAAIAEGDSLTICELLLPDGPLLQAVSALSELHPAEDFIVRSPAFWGEDQGGNIREHVVVVSPPGRQFPVRNDAYWGPAFD
ncbi:MAG: GNAT family N-acetyltransferase [Oscillospiraceae bacterium]|jgi:GNAT superfamily N-acetyltransferase